MKASMLTCLLVVAGASSLLLSALSGCGPSAPTGPQAPADVEDAVTQLTDSFEDDRARAQMGSSSLRVQPVFQAALELNREGVEALMAPARTSPAYVTELADTLLSPLHAYAKRFEPGSTIDEELLRKRTFAKGETFGYGFGLRAYLLLELVQQQRSADLAREVFAAFGEVVRADSYLAGERWRYWHEEDAESDGAAELARELEQFGGEITGFFGMEIAAHCEAFLTDLYLSDGPPYLPPAAMARVEEYAQWRAMALLADGSYDWLEFRHMFTTIGCIRDLAALLQ
jgi:hypothetical protein